MSEKHIFDVIAAAQLVYSGRAGVDDPVGRLTGELLRQNLPALTGSFPPSKFPITAHIAEALRHSSPVTRPFLDAVAPALPFLPWKYNYEPRADLPDLGLKMAWGEIIGPEAPFVSDRFCLGLTLIAPKSFYPLHRHPATELYWVVSGTAEWTLEGKVTRRAPGSFILHDSNAVHAMRTFDEPLLALYSWSGPDVVTLSSYL